MAKADTIKLPTIQHVTLPWRVKFRPISKKTGGYCDWDNRLLEVNSSLSPVEQLSAMLHEVGHAVTGFDEDRTVAIETGMINAVRFMLRRYPELGESETFDELAARMAPIKRGPTEGKASGEPRAD